VSALQLWRLTCLTFSFCRYSRYHMWTSGSYPDSRIPKTL
jgi:hypothetical protein